MENVTFHRRHVRSRNMVKMHRAFHRLIYYLFILFLLTANIVKAQNNWEQQYNELKKTIDKHFYEPPGSTDDLGVFLGWIGIKGKELNRAKQLLNEANQLYITHPGDQNYNQWVQKFFNLVEYAEQSGDYTVWLASIKLLRKHENGVDDNWMTPLSFVKRYGRKIFLKAKESGFETVDPEQRSICLLNFSLGMLESDAKNDDPDYDAGYSLYRGRLLYDAIPVNGGEALSLPDYLDTDCDGRKMFYRWTEGKPDKTIMYAFTNVDKIREECKWWGFGDIWQDATDLMNEYYEDALCKIPPHDSKLGHKYFLQLAEEKDLEKSIKYNKGFYGTLYGKVEILIDGSKKPAPRAKVIVEDYDETWTTTADDNGRYTIEHVILHKDCSPFDIYARYKGYDVDDTYNGPLTKPDSTARFRKDLLIDPGIAYKWFGNFTALLTENSRCSKYVQKDLTLQHAKLRIRAQHIDISQPVIALSLGDLDASGSVSGKYEYVFEEEESDDHYHYHKHVIKNMHGQKVFPVTKDNLLNITIISEKLMDKGAMQQMAAMAKKVATGNYSEEEIEKIAAQMENQMSDDNESFPVRVMVQINGNWRGKVSTYEYIREIDNGKIITNEENSGSVELDLAGPIMLELKGTCTKRKDGTVTIRADIHESKKDPDCVQISNNATFMIKSTVVKN